MSHWISLSSRWFPFSPIILASSLPYSPGFVSEFFKKDNIFPLVWQVSREGSPWLPGSRGAEAVPLVISAVFSSWQWVSLDKVWTWFLPVSLEPPLFTMALFPQTAKAYLLVTTMNTTKPAEVLPVKTVYSLGGICNFAACNSKSLENTTHTSFISFFLWKDTFFYIFSTDELKYICSPSWQLQLLNGRNCLQLGNTSQYDTFVLTNLYLNDPLPFYLLYWCHFRKLAVISVVIKQLLY